MDLRALPGRLRSAERVAIESWMRHNGAVDRPECLSLDRCVSALATLTLLVAGGHDFIPTDPARAWVRRPTAQFSALVDEAKPT